MVRPTCQLNLTLDVPTAEKIELISQAVNQRPSGTGRVLLLQSIKFVESGLDFTDESQVESVIKFIVETSKK